MGLIPSSFPWEVWLCGIHLSLSLSLIEKETRMLRRRHQNERISLLAFLPMETFSTSQWPITTELTVTSGQRPGDIPTKLLPKSIFLFLHSISFCLPLFPGSPVAHTDLELNMCQRMTLIPLHLPLQGYGYKHALPHSFYMVLGTKLRAYAH